MAEKALLALFVIFTSPAFAHDALGPCHAKSRAMALIKTCFTGDMGRPIDGGSQFFTSIDTEGASYCYNHFVSMEQKSGEKIVQVRVLRDSKLGALEEYDYAISATELAASRVDTPYVSLIGLHGRCYTAAGTNPNCASGWMTWLGLRERDLPMTLALGKTALGTYTVSHLVSDRGEIKSHHGQRLRPRVSTDTRYAVYQTAQEIQQRLVNQLRLKNAQLNQSGMTPKKMSENSEQFRFCALALENFIKENNLPDILSPQNKNDLARVTSYMNEPNQERRPASIR